MECIWVSHNNCESELTLNLPTSIILISEIINPILLHLILVWFFITCCQNLVLIFYSLLQHPIILLCWTNENECFVTCLLFFFYLFAFFICLTSMRAESISSIFTRVYHSIWHIVGAQEIFVKYMKKCHLHMENQLVGLDGDW